MASPCDGCVAPCCREPHVVLTGREALRIAAALSLPLAEFTELRARERCEGEFRIRLAGPEPGAGRYHRLQLRRVPTPDEAYGQRCVFLRTSGTEVRCGVYTHRPAPCRAFPFQMERGAARLCRIARAYCPPDAWRPEDAGELPRRVAERELDRAIYDALIDEWNAQLWNDALPDAARFFAFLHAAYAQIERTVPLLFDGSAGAQGWDAARVRGAVADGLRGLFG